MPKITLLNTETKQEEEFEPIDAREALAGKDSIYKPTKDAEKRLGLTLESGANADINVPQLQGQDAEMQTGSSTQKYDRQAVVKAEPGNPDQVRDKEAEKAPKSKG